MKTIFSFLLTFLFSVSILAQKEYATKDVIEIGGDISFANTTQVINGETADKSSTMFSFSPVFGYFVADGLELALVPQISTYSYDKNSSTSLALFFAPSYNFRADQKVFPYVTGAIGYTSVSNDNGSATSTSSGLSYGGGAGVKVALSESALLHIGVQYILITLNPENADKRYGQNQFSIEAGFLFWFN